ncbi:oxidoreductase [Natrinema sp. CBA1119]|uniref:enoyl-CoA hydratase/isomerase family protein n=1 Tax=Natrinema sp. CBA1119 TaxID=1608465 RepID=UPI000BF322B3|nr:enoyl-CoA hydratase/isomerase family protein [Natrinema sp. CBA1119]PGF13911.1 oxidoreductase [Natrinema sp. CBA1119]
MTQFDKIEYSVTDERAEIVFDRPDVLNAFDAQMLEEITEALYEAMTDQAVSVVLLTGNGRGFCSGADVSNMDGRDDRDTPWDYRAHLGMVQNVVRLLYNGEKPTIAAINGPAIGAGCDFALACDLRVASEEAVLRQQFVNIGLVPGDGGGWLLPRLIGESKAKEYLLTGKDITPEAALADGLVVDVVEDGETRSTARELGNDIAAKPRTGVRGTKSLVDVSQSFEEYTQAAFERQWECVNDAEHSEAVAAMREGREPDFDREE